MFKIIVNKVHILWFTMYLPKPIQKLSIIIIHGTNQCLHSDMPFLFKSLTLVFIDIR